MENSNWNYADDTRYGTQYATENKQKYDYGFQEVGKFDMPAMIDEVVKVSGQPKVTYVSYSMASLPVFYGLTQKEG